MRALRSTLLHFDVGSKCTRSKQILFTRPGMLQAMEMKPRPSYTAPLNVGLGVIAQFGRNALCVLKALIPSDHFLNRKSFSGYSPLTIPVLDWELPVAEVTDISWLIAVSDFTHPTLDDFAFPSFPTPCLPVKETVKCLYTCI